MENGVAETVVMRSLRNRYAAYASEVDRFIRAGLQVMQRHQTLNPRVTEIIQESGLSNQAFYRHFRSKDELLIAILDDGSRQLVNYLDHLMSREASPSARVQRWVEGVLAQAANPVSADATRPFVVESLRLATQFPEEASRSRESLLVPLRQALQDAIAAGELAGIDEAGDAEAIYHLVMGSMQGYLVRGEVPAPSAVARLARFVLAGLRGQGGVRLAPPVRRGGAARGA